MTEILVCVWFKAGLQRSENQQLLVFTRLLIDPLRYGAWTRRPNGHVAPQQEEGEE